MIYGDYPITASAQNSVTEIRVFSNQMALTPLTEVLGVKRAAHLLRRATFGGTKQDIDQLAAMTPQEAMTVLFDTNLPDAEPPIDPATGAEWVTTGPTDANSEENSLQGYFLGWLLGQYLRSTDLPPTQRLAYNVRERIGFFLHTHFTTMVSKVRSSRALYFQNQLFRMFALDDTADPWRNFRDLTKKICVDNAMLVFLDGRLNVSGNPNENYARELLELYSIGRGLEGTLPQSTEPGDYFNFTELDVQEAARVLSGFDADDTFTSMDPDTGLPRGVVRGGNVATAHDNDSKTFSNRFDASVIQPDELLLDAGEPTEASALDEISQLIDLIFSKEETTRHICRKLYRFFVYYEISDTVESNVIGELANTFVSSGYRIQPVLEELFQSEHFYTGATGYEDDRVGAIIKSPLDLVCGAVRFFDLELPDPQSDLEGHYTVMGNLLRWMDLQGMNFYEPFEVAGYAAYHQFPAFNRNWISTNYLTRRYEFVKRVMTAEGMMEPGEIGIDLLTYAQAEFASVGGNARDLIQSMVTYLLPLHENTTFDSASDDNAELTAERVNYFLFAFLFNPQFDADPEAAWATRWNTLEERDLIVGQLERLLNAIMQSPEYQLA